MNEKQLYSDQIIQLYRSPINYGELEGANAKLKESNPLCGDYIEVQLKVSADGKIEDAKFTGKGCAISQASACLLTESSKGKTLQEIDALGKEEVLKLLGIDIGPARIKCALLPLKAMQMVSYKFQGKDEMDVKWKA